jgi:hypothetical protein
MKLYTNNSVFKSLFLQTATICFFLISSASIAAKAEKQFITKGKLLKIYNEELVTIKKSELLAVDELWALKNISTLNADKKLAKFINGRMPAVAEDPFILLLDPSAKRVALPKDLGKGAFQLYHFMLSPVGQPKSRAISFLKEFLSIESTGYILNHQLLALEWAKKTKLVASNSFKLIKKELLNAIYKEQNQDNEFSDLYTERAVILMNYGSPSLKDQKEWIKTMIDARTPFGGWGIFETNTVFDGQEAIVKPGDIHTRVLVIWAMQLYINNNL